MNKYTLTLQNDQLDLPIEFIKFCVSHQQQDIELMVNQESHCLRFCGVYDILDMFKFTSVTIYTANAVEWHDRYIIKPLPNWCHWLTRAQKFDYSYDYTWNGSKVFGCFYGRPTAPRLGIAGYLAKNYANISLIKVRFDSSTEDTRKQYELTKLHAWNGNISGAATLLENISKYQSEYTAYDYTTDQYDYSNGINYLYKDIFVDIVSEATNFGNTFYPTEKIVRAILCKKPFIVMSSTNYLQYLKQIGFKTFDKFWLESYDYFSGAHRYNLILNLIDQIATLPLIDIQNKITNIVEHNYNLLVTNQFKKQVRLI
jgi:hypothetical protein